MSKKQTRPGAPPPSTSKGPRKSGYVIGALHAGPHGKQYKCHLLHADPPTHQKKGTHIVVERVKSAEGSDPVCRQWLKDKDGTLYPRTHFKSALSAFNFDKE